MIQGDVVVVGPEVLETVDADTPPSGLVYDVSSPATNGRLAFIDDTPTHRPSIDSFTQHDINSRRVVFIHDGSKEPGAIYLKVRLHHSPKFSGIVAGAEENYLPPL